MNTVFGEKNKCCGCRACEKSCPVNAIKMVKDEEGFLYPEIDEKLCVKCGLCKKICNFNEEINKNKQEVEKVKCENKEEIENENLNEAKCNFEVEVYAVKNKDENIRKISTSGGFFNIISSYIIQKNGIVYGAVLNENLKVKHQSAVSQEELKKFYGSKYVQSNLENCYENIEIGRASCRERV